MRNRCSGKWQQNYSTRIKKELLDTIWYYLLLFDTIWHYLTLFDTIWYYLILLDTIWYYLIVFDTIYLILFGSLMQFSRCKFGHFGILNSVIEMFWSSEAQLLLASELEVSTVSTPILRSAWRVDVTNHESKLGGTKFLNQISDSASVEPWACFRPCPNDVKYWTFNHDQYN